MTHSKTTLRSLLVLTLGATLGVGTLSAQNNNERSPYSRFGYGRLGERQTTATRSLGGVRAAMRNGLVINPANPASYTAVDSLTFLMDIAVSARSSVLSEGDKSDSRLLGNLDYATILFPVTHYLAVSAGIMPYSSVGYQFGNSSTLEGTTTGRSYVRTYSGQGGYSDLYLGVGGRLGNLSLGINGSYLFGYSQQERVVTLGSTDAYNPVYRTQLHLKGLRMDVGAQYVIKINESKRRSLTLGATFTPEFKLRSEQIDQSFPQGITSSIRTVPTISDTLSATGLHRTPLSWSAGATYQHNEHVMIGADVSYMKWGRGATPSADGAYFDNRYRIGLGVDWVPNERARSAFSRAHYRFGVNGANSYLRVPTTDINSVGYYDLGASVGVGLPLLDRRSVLNLSIDYTYLKPKQSGLLREHSIGLTVGLTFNEGWFKKARIN